MNKIMLNADEVIGRLSTKLAMLEIERDILDEQAKALAAEVEQLKKQLAAAEPDKGKKLEVIEGDTKHSRDKN